MSAFSKYLKMVLFVKLEEKRKQYCNIDIINKMAKIQIKCKLEKQYNIKIVKNKNFLSKYVDKAKCCCYNSGIRCETDVIKIKGEMKYV